MSKQVEVTIEDHLGRITLNRAPLNALSNDFIKEIHDSILELGAKPECWGILIDSALEKFFCNGMDPEPLLKVGVPERAKSFEGFLKMCRDLFAVTKPTVCAISGHAMAGGAMIAIMTDFRFFSDARYSFCFSEVKVGMTIPGVLIDIIESVTGPAPLRRLAMLGEAFKAPECLQIGIADRVVPTANLIEESKRYLRSTFDLPLASMKSVKGNIRKDLVRKFDEFLGPDGEKFTDFLGPSFEEGLTAVMERRRPKFNV